MSDSPPRPLSRGLRFAIVVCLLLVGFMGLFSASEAMALSRFEELRRSTESVQVDWLGDPSLAKKVFEARMSALEPMRTSRIVLLGALSMACAFAFVSSLRLLRPGGLPREGMRRFLGGGALVAAVLRTLDGAQWAVVSRRMGLAMARNLQHLPQLTKPQELQQVKDALPSLMVAGSVIQTFVVVAMLLGFAQYFRSDRVRAAVAGSA